MAELAHLEKMGRELKCPICLDLLDSAMSLSCNHIFCNACIRESLKSVSDCPVCKVPFRRREVRAAPHMDNLVCIYKSMEVSAGTNMFSIPMGPPTQSADILAPGNQKKDNITTETGGKCQKRSKKKGSSKMRKGKVTTDANSLPHRSPLKPSFPAKKRVHVTPYPVSETPLRPPKMSKLEDPGSEHTVNTESHDHAETAADSVEDPLFSPFFWLRGDDDEIDGESPKKQSSEQIMETPSPHVAPCFSDMKDSDDEKPTAVTPTNKLKNAEADYSDSEMFEWTQRPCSPELCSTPQRSQMATKHRLDKASQNECQENSVMVTTCATVLLADEKAGLIGANARILRRKRKCKSISLSDSRKSSMKNNSVVPEASQQSPNLSAKTRELNAGKKSMVSSRSNRKMKMENSKQQRKHMIKSNDAQAKLSAYDFANEEEQDKISLINSSDMSNSVLEHIKDGKFSCAVERVKEIQKQKIGELNVSVANDQAKEQESKTSVQMAAASINHTACENKESKMNLCARSSTKNRIHNPKNIVLKKSENSISQVLCAFCQSPNDTEDSGEMMHYLSGKPVASDFNGGANVIHSHKHCTEWAPDVYFEDEVAVNLAAEVSRSRRIKCSCCGVKGAALGCYEKSCRKSFHYTCAKLMRECKWDTENFVMLCPLHSSIKLPNEVSETPRQSRKRSTPNGPKGIRSSQSSSASKHCDQQRQMWTWPFGSPCKWVLCCSALSADEKETVAKFSKITGAPVSNTWNQEVTHVIASTDSSGACRRTLKILKGILDGKWILKVDWIKACMEAMEPVNEEKFEVTVDVYGTSGGPRLGRLRCINKRPKIFSGLRFFFIGGYTASYKGFLQDLVSSAGGAILQRKPISRDHDRLLGETSTCKTIIVFSCENSEKKRNCNNEEAVADDRRSEAQALADASGGTLVASTWIIDSVAACQLQPLT